MIRKVRLIIFITTRHSWVQTHLVIQPSTHRAVGSTFLIQEADEISFCATTFIIQWLILAVPGEEFDGWKTADLIFLGELCVLLRIAVNVCNDALFITLHNWQTRRKPGENIHHSHARKSWQLSWGYNQSSKIISRYIAPSA